MRHRRDLGKRVQREGVQQAKILTFKNASGKEIQLGAGVRIGWDLTSWPGVLKSVVCTGAVSAEFPKREVWKFRCSTDPP